MTGDAVNDALEAVRVTADRVRRFSSEVERDPSEEVRQLWRASLFDLRATIRRARANGWSTAVIQEAAGERPTGRFLRAEEPHDCDPTASA